MQKDILTTNFDSEMYDQGLISLRSVVRDYNDEAPYHNHSKAQLILPLNGAVQSKVGDNVWVAPIGSALWIPGYVYHSNLIVKGSDVCMVFIDKTMQKQMPNKACVIYISPLIKELILYLSQQKISEQSIGDNQKLSEVLVTQLSMMLPTFYNFCLPSENNLREVALEWFEKPTKYKYISDMAYKCAVSDKTLSRKIKKYVGMNFSEWKKQLHIVLALQKLYEGYSVQWISDYLGYESASIFITFFKKVFKCSPKKYIKEYFL